MTFNAPANFPNGWFFGVAINPLELSAEIAVGAPFFGVLSPTGTSTFTVPAGMPPDILFNAVTIALAPGGLVVTGVSSPIPFMTI